MLIGFFERFVIRLDAPLFQFFQILSVLNVRMSVIVAVEVLFVMMTMMMIVIHWHWNRYVMMMMRYLESKFLINILLKFKKFRCADFLCIPDGDDDETWYRDSNNSWSKA